MILCCAHTVINDPSLLEELLPTLIGTFLGGGISVGLAVYLFRRENDRESLSQVSQESSLLEAKRKEIERSWYLNVLINPNLSRIEGFFDNSKVTTIVTLSQLLKAKQGSVEEYNSLKAERRIIFKDEVRQFEYDFIKLIQSNSKGVSDSLMEWLRGFDDIISNYFDQVINSEVIDDDDLLQRLSVSKAEFYRIINQPLKNE
jgi:hypothetical protein